MVKTKKSETETKKLRENELKENLQRLQAEFDNYRKREEKQASQRIKEANSELIKELLSVLDNLELALQSTDNNKKGIELVYGQITGILAEFGLKRMESLRSMFNPETHEAMLVEASKEDKNKIIEVYQEGYFLNEKVLRHARVKLSGGTK